VFQVCQSFALVAVAVVELLETMALLEQGVLVVLLLI
jgi:hypothetical protein